MSFPCARCEEVTTHSQDCPENASLLELMAASPKFMETLRDLKRLERYMTESEKQRVVELVRKAMGAR